MKKKKKEIPSYEKVKSWEWMFLSTALRMIAGEGATYKRELNNMRGIANYAAKDGELEVIKTQGTKYKSTRQVRPVPFFQWAYKKWPDECRRLGVPQNHSEELTNRVSSSSECIGIILPGTLEGCHKYIEKLEHQLHEAQKEIAELRPDAEKYRAQKKGGKATGGIRY